MRHRNPREGDRNKEVGGTEFKFGQLILWKIFATRCHILRLTCTKFDFCWGCAPGAQTPLEELTALPQAPSWIYWVLLLSEARGEGGGEGEERWAGGEVKGEEGEFASWLWGRRPEISPPRSFLNVCAYDTTSCVYAYILTLSLTLTLTLTDAMHQLLIQILLPNSLFRTLYVRKVQQSFQLNTDVFACLID